MDSFRFRGGLTVGPKPVEGLGTQRAPADVDYQTTMNIESLKWPDMESGRLQVYAGRQMSAFKWCLASLA